MENNSKIERTKEQLNSTQRTQKKGKDSPFFKSRVGENHLTNEGYTVVIINYKGTFNCDIQFENGVILYDMEYGAVKNGQIKNPYHPSVYGVGYFGEGNYKTTVDGVITKHIITWNSMFNRIYNLKNRNKYTTYKDVTVCEEWKCFQNFAAWFDDNYKPEYMQGWALDKDILVKGNKIYSPETCGFVPREVNTLFTKRQNKRGELPIGVHKLPSGRFQASFTANSVNVYLGSFDTIEEAFNAYKIAKEEYIKEVADKWRGQITEQIYQAMYEYKVEIDD